MRMSNSANLKKHHHQSAYKLNNQSHNSNSVYNRINHSTSFVIAEGTQDSSLDTCPKCGRNVCEHTSVADVINLPNSISQDFSTYSSDSSLIKQLMNESTSSTGTVRSSTNRCIDYETMSPLPGIPMEPNTTNLMFSQIFAHFSKQQKQHQPPTAAMSNYITFNVLRPVSCQYVLDTETTDRLLKDFFESTPNSSENATREKLLGLVTNTKPKLTSNKSEKTTQTIETNQDVMMLGSAKSATNKKPKFSNLRLLLNGKNSSISSTVSSSSSSSSSATNTAKSPFKSQILRSTTNPFVNCLTSSSTSSSSSYEEINSNSNAAIIMQENHSSSTCESKENTIRKQEAPSTSSASSNHLFMTSESVNNSNSEQQYLFKHDTTASDIERKPNTLKMNNTNRSVVSLNSKITSDLYDETDYNELHGLELCPIVGREIDDEDIDIRTNHQKQPKTNIENDSLISVRLNNSLTYEYKKKDESSTKINSTTSVINEEETPNKSPSAKKIDISMPLVCRLKNRLSYFSSCSSCDFHSSRESCLDMSDSLGSSVQGIRYHSISVIFIIMALFSLNLVQESYFLFHYFISEQFYWFTYAVVSIFTGQVLTLILSLVSEIDLARITQRAVKSSSSSSSASSSTATKENLMNLSSDKNRSLKISKNYDLYRVFSNPFSKLALIMPGFLPICVYSQFLRTLFEYRKSSARNRFRHEFKLSIYLFLTALFFSMPIAVLNSCYLASITKWSNSLNKTDPSTSQPVQWYYTELFSVFTTSTLFNKTSESSSSHVSESSSAESFSRVVNHRKNAAATLSSETTLMQINAKNQFLLVLISIFFSVSIGICVFVTYYELLKQNYEHVSNKTKSVEGFGKVRRSRNRNLSSNEKPFIPLNESSQEVVERSPDLGLIEILVYFCYRFCLIISRLAALALVCYLFQQWMFVFLAGHVLLVYLSSFMCLSSSATKSCLHQQISHFIVCLLSFVDLFSSQIAELANFRKVIAYYALYFVQNVSVCTYWLVRTVYEAQLNRNHKPADSNSNSASLFISSTTTCYATLVYLCIILFTIFGLILKFLHLHILRKRYRQNL